MSGVSRRLKHRIQLKRYVLSRNALGEDVPSYEDWLSRWAHVHWVSDQERLRVDQIQTEARIRVTVRSDACLADLTEKDRLAHKGREFNILGIKPVGDDRLLEITAGHIQ